MWMRLCGDGPKAATSQHWIRASETETQLRFLNSTNKTKSTQNSMAKQLNGSNSKPTHEEIAQRARAIYEQKGRVPGHDLENWLEAEAQLNAGRKTSSESRPAARPPAKLALHP
jgi:hypothetical protein